MKVMGSNPGYLLKSFLLYLYLVQIFDSSARSQSAFGGQVQYYIMPATSATKFSSKRKAMAASPQPQSSFKSSTKSGIFETIVFTKKILQTTKSGGGPANKRQQSCTSLSSAVGFFFFLTLLSKRTSLLMGSTDSIYSCSIKLLFILHPGFKLWRVAYFKFLFKYSRKNLFFSLLY